MNSLPIFLRLAGQPVILVGEGEAADAKRRILERAGANIVDADNQNARIAIVASDSDAEAETTATDLKARGILVNAVDRPKLCDFTLPAIVDRDPVLIAIGTGGTSAGMAKAIRQRLERMLPAGLGKVADRIKQLRPRIRERWPDMADRRTAIDESFDEGSVLDPFAAHEPEAVDRWLENSTEHQRPNQFETIQLRSLDPHDLTIGETLLMGRADRIYVAPGVPGTIANRARADAERIEASEAPEEPGPGLSVFIAPPED